MIALPHGLFQVIIGLDCFFLVFIVDSMALQNPKDWEFSLAHLPSDLIQFSQLSISRWRVRNEVETSERRAQPCSDLDPQQLPLTSFKSLQPDTRILVIILEAEVMLIEGHQVVLEGCFQNTNEGQMVSRLFDEIGHRLWFQGPFNHLGGERRTNYIAAIFHKILIFFAYINI
jgi:hypothetical protein